jgi:predicted chitinase
MDANLSSVLTVLIQTLGTAFAVWVAYRQTISKVASKAQVEEVHKTVNGNLHRVTEKAEKYAAKLRANGFDPDAD